MTADHTLGYYFTGPLSDLYTLPTTPMPATTDYPFAMKCYKGCTYEDLQAGEAKCTGGTTGVTSSYVPTALEGVTTAFVSGPASAQGMLCSSTDDTATTTPAPVASVATDDTATTTAPTTAPFADNVADGATAAAAASGLFATFAIVAPFL